MPSSKLFPAALLSESGQRHQNHVRTHLHGLINTHAASAKRRPSDRKKTQKKTEEDKSMRNGITHLLCGMVALRATGSQPAVGSKTEKKEACPIPPSRRRPGAGFHPDGHHRHQVSLH